MHHSTDKFLIEYRSRLACQNTRMLQYMNHKETDTRKKKKQQNAIFFFSPFRRLFTSVDARDVLTVEDRVLVVGGPAAIVPAVSALRVRPSSALPVAVPGATAAARASRTALVASPGRQVAHAILAAVHGVPTHTFWQRLGVFNLFVQLILELVKLR